MEEHYLLIINDRHFITARGVSPKEVVDKTLSSHPYAITARVIGEVNEIINILKPFILLDYVPVRNS